MFRRSARPLAAAAIAGLMLGGCATRGYVNDRIAEADARSAGDLTRVRETASGAGERADQAFRDAGEARDLALGNVDWTETGSSTVTFAFDSAELSDAARAELDRVAGTVAASRRARVDLYGYTCTIGSERYNEMLSARRANAVLRYLLEASRAPLTRFTIVGLGETAPIGEGADEDHEASRRVVVSVLEASPPRKEARISRVAPAGDGRS